jgi:hypothetical protein
MNSYGWRIILPFTSVVVRNGGEAIEAEIEIQRRAE